MAYVNTPIASDDLDISQPQIQGNFLQANTSFGTDHYAFSDLTGNNGFHKVIRSPDQVNHPAFGLQPQIYGLQRTSATGVQDYSMGTLNQIPTPLTNFQAPTSGVIIAGGAVSPVLDFMNTTRAMCMFYANDGTSKLNNLVAYIVWTGSTLLITQITTGTKLTAVAAGSVLQISNSVAPSITAFWTLVTMRLE